MLRPGGLGLIYVWAKEQERQQKKSHYISNLAHTNKKGSDGMSKREDRTAALVNIEESSPAEECLDLEDNISGDVTSSHGIPQPEQVDSMRETDRSMNSGVTCVTGTGSLISQDASADDKGQMTSEHVTTPPSNAAIEENTRTKM